MTLRTATFATVALAALSGCATATGGPDEPGIDILQGCWIEKHADGSVSTLRLAPGGQANEELAGYRSHSGGRYEASSVRYAFARDGSRMTIGEGKAAQTFRRGHGPNSSPSSPDPPGEKHMDFLKERSRTSEDWYVVSVFGDALSINSVLITPFEVAPYNITGFKRDKCDEAVVLTRAP